MTEDHKPPYKCLMHYDPTRQGVWIGYGRDLDPICGQPEYIGVTGNSEMVECEKCLSILQQT